MNWMRASAWSALMVTSLMASAAHGGVALVFQHFHAVDHRAQRPDKVVADAADQQGGKFDLGHDGLNAAPMVSKWLICFARS